MASKRASTFQVVVTNEQLVGDYYKPVSIEVGPKVKSLAAASAVVENLEQEWDEWFEKWSAADYPEPEATDWRGIYEGSDVELHASNGDVYDLDDDEWVKR